MEAATENKRAEGVVAPTAHDSHHCTCDCARRQTNMQAAGMRTLATYNGTALRHLREAQSLALRQGPCAPLGAEMRRARDAVDFRHLAL